MQQVTLAHRGPGAYALLRELRGADEAAIEGGGTPAALALLDRLLVAVPGAAVAPGAAATLTAADRDRLLAAVYRATYGARVQSTLRCSVCGERFDMDFSLDDLLASLGDGAAGSAAPGGATREADGSVTLATGARLRLPTGADECAVAGLPDAEAPRALLARCVIEGALPPDDGAFEAIEDALERIAPIVAADLDAVCPECGASQPAAFDLQEYLLGSLRAEQRQLAMEVHRLARAYGWSRTEILEMPRARRREHVDLVESELLARRQGVLT